MKLVTGAGGFIGSNLVAALEAIGHEIAVCDWFDVPEKMKNLENRRIAERISPDGLLEFMQDRAGEIETVFHMGAISSTIETNVALITDINVTLPIQIWLWCRDHEVPLIYASSAATYGDGALGFDDDETVQALQRLQPLNPYGRSKNAFDIWVAEQVAGRAAVPPQWVGLKFFNVYGPNEYHKGGQMSVVPQVFKQISETDRARLFQSHNPDYEDGGQLRDFVWVGDCVEVMLWLEAHPTVSGLYNCGTGQARSFLDLATTVFHALGKDVVIDYVPTPEAIRDKYQYFTEANMAKLRAAGYDSSFTSLEDGVGRYVSDYLMVEDAYLCSGGPDGHGILC